MKDKFFKKNYIIKKFNVKTTFINSYNFIKKISYILYYLRQITFFFYFFIFLFCFTTDNVLLFENCLGFVEHRLSMIVGGTHTTDS
jgi:hypothetical protein